jgi:hypothetical protein
VTTHGTDDYHNILVAGYLYARLNYVLPDLDAQIDIDPAVNNQLLIRVPFMTSQYRLTVERAPSPKPLCNFTGALSAPDGVSVNE